MSGQTAGRPAAKPAATDLRLALTTERATMGTLALEKLRGRARVTSDAVRLDPVEFALFGGSFKGSLQLAAGGTPTYHLNATIASLDVAAATASAGSGATISGRLSGRIDLTGLSTDATHAMNSARGTARVDIVNGVVKNLGLVRAIVIATSMRSNAA